MAGVSSPGALRGAGGGDATLGLLAAAQTFRPLALPLAAEVTAWRVGLVQDGGRAGYTVTAGSQVGAQ